MRTRLEIQQRYSEEYMIEINISIITVNVSADISCYIQIEKLQELSELCLSFLENSEPFDWEVKSKELSYFRLKVYEYDKCGNVKIDLTMINNNDSTEFERMYCECCLMIELGQVEYLGNKIATLNDFTTVIIENEINI